MLLPECITIEIWLSGSAKCHPEKHFPTDGVRVIFTETLALKGHAKKCRGLKGSQNFLETNYKEYKSSDYKYGISYNQTGIIIEYHSYYYVFFKSALVSFISLLLPSTRPEIRELVIIQE